MPAAKARTLDPRKTPTQARAAASVEAILQATIQLLLKHGKSRLTTTRIAERAGVSVGTLYQYFPNEGSLLQPLLRDHLDRAAQAMEEACQEVHGAPVARIAWVVATTFVRAKFEDMDRSAALYAVSDEIEANRVCRTMQARSTRAISAALASLPNRPIADPDLAAATLWNAMAGVSRAALESKPTHRHTAASMEQELALLARAYLQASARTSTSKSASRALPCAALAAASH